VPGTWHYLISEKHQIGNAFLTAGMQSHDQGGFEWSFIVESRISSLEGRARGIDRTLPPIKSRLIRSRLSVLHIECQNKHDQSEYLWDQS
jgi:hypothetical protein